MLDLGIVKQLIRSSMPMRNDFATSDPNQIAWEVEQIEVKKNN